jgi:hypothetical protein
LLNPSDLTDAEWERIVPLLPKPPRRGRKASADLRTILDAIRKRWHWVKHLFADGAYNRTALMEKAALRDFVIEVVRRISQRTNSQTDSQTARLARIAHNDFGKGSGHPARLNFGDCFAYAPAKERDAPLLYKGHDFGLTDIRSAL